MTEHNKEKPMSTTTEMHDLLYAWDGDKTIEKCLASGQWVVECDHPCMWNWSLVRRIKRIPVYRPLKQEELFKLKDVWLLEKGTKGRYKVCAILNSMVWLPSLGYASNGVLLDGYTYEDGTPVGVLE